MAEVVIRKGEPIKLPNGDVVLPSSMSADDVAPTKKGADVKSSAALEVEAEMQQLLGDPLEEVQFERTLADINVPHATLSTTMLITAFSVWGLKASAIARVLNITESSVEAVIESDLFSQLRKELVEAIRYAETGTIHGYLQRKAALAAAVVASSMTSKDGDRALKAAQDVLDRSGFRPVDRVEHSHKFEDELRIRYLAEPQIPTINITPVEDF